MKIKQTTTKLAQQQQQQQQRQILKTYGLVAAPQQGPEVAPTAGVGGLRSASGGGGRADGGLAEARPSGSSGGRSRSIGDTASVALLKAVSILFSSAMPCLFDECGMRFLETSLLGLIWRRVFTPPPPDVSFPVAHHPHSSFRTAHV